MNAGRSHQSLALAELFLEDRSVEQLSKVLGITRRQAADAAAGLIAKGYAARPERGQFCITEDGRDFHRSGAQITSGSKTERAAPKNPRKRTIRTRAWNAMRILKKFTIADLIQAAAHGGEEDPRRNLGKFCAALHRAGILRKLRVKEAGTKPSSNGFVRYQLLNDLGELAPTISVSKKRVIDHNSGKEFPF